jgi:hypothetical protein
MAERVKKPRFVRFPVVSLSAEFLAMGHLMRRNILAYKAPPGNEGYDVICVHPDPRHVGPQVRVQVKSRLATDCDRGFPVREGTLDAFDFLIVVFLNVGYFMHKAKGRESRDGARPPELYTLPAAFVRQHHEADSSWQKVRTRGLDLSPYRDEAGFELIAAALGVPYPSKHHPGPA